MKSLIERASYPMIARAAALCGMSRREFMLSKKRGEPMVTLRWMIYRYLLDERFNVTMISVMFRRNHSTVIYGINRLKELEEIGDPMVERLKIEMKL